MNALQELRTLRAQIKSANERISQITDEATQQAVDILAAQGKDRGEFYHRRLHLPTAGHRSLRLQQLLQVQGQRVHQLACQRQG